MANCKARVYRDGWSTGGTCSRTAQRDGYCHQHHPDSVAERAADDRAVRWVFGFDPARPASKAERIAKLYRWGACRQRCKEAKTAVLEAAEAFVASDTDAPERYAELEAAVRELEEAREALSASQE